ncbi:MFS transporter [bacterium]|nr:MFS transporter [candidate division CSSED10-310 bacterium]
MNRIIFRTMSLSVADQTRNFRLAVWNGIIFQLTSPFLDISLILPLFLSGLTDSAVVIGLAGALMLAGGSIMQAPAASILPRMSSRMKLYLNVGWVRIFALFSLLLMVFAVYPLTRSRLGLLVGSLICLSVLQLSTGFSSLAFLEIVRTSMPASHRGRLWGYRKFIGGIGILLCTPLVRWILARYPYPANYGVLFGIVWMLTCIAIAVFGLVRETKHRIDPDAPGFRNHLHSTLVEMSLEPGFGRLATAQVLISVWMMALPFYILHAKQFMRIDPRQVALLLAAQITGKILSNILWANLDDRFSSQLIYRWLPIPAVLAPVILLLIPSGSTHAMIWLSVAFFVMGTALTGIEIGYTNITLDLADRRASAGGIGVMNSINGILSLMPLAGGLCVHWLGYRWLFILTAAAGLLVYPVSVRLAADFRQIR